MPFGLKIAPTFQTMMNSILRPYIDRFVLIYLDDFLVYSNSAEEYREHVQLVLEALHKSKLHAKPAKCSFAQSEVEFCGHIVGGGTIRVLDKIQVIRDWPVPKNVHQVRQFFGLANCYRRFIKGFGSITPPLASLFKQDGENKRKNRPIIWTAACQVAFKRLKQALTNAPVLH